MNKPQILSGRIERPWPSAEAALRRRLKHLRHTAWLWHERARQRRHLRILSDHMLRDLGLSRTDLQAEAAKPFWRG
jgi:uncharacterized protein YjiS (DUF1127 family)